MGKKKIGEEALLHVRSLLFSVSVLLSLLSLASADLIHGCGSFVEVSLSVIKWRKSTDRKLDYSHITVELRTVDGLV